jgi:Ca2+-binding RTX toxin-like protein
VRTSRRSAVLLLALAAFLLSATSASATLTVVAATGIDPTENPSIITLGVVGSGGEDPSVRFEDPDITVNNSGGVVLSQSAADQGCTQDSNNLKVTCPDGVFGDFQAAFDGNNDGLSEQVCFHTGEVDMGDGTNNYQGPACLQPLVYTVFGGSGEDSFSGSNNTQSKTVDQFAGQGGNDTLFGGYGDDVSVGGDGNDFVTDSAGNDQLYGEGGDDVIRGDEGNDIEDGGPGNDRIGYSPGVSNDDDTGADKLNGGPGDDRLILDGHSGGMNISLDGQPNDGSPGEGDNVGSDFEHIDGTNSNDVFTGSAGHDQFSGGQGDDEIHGGGGDDDLYGGSGDDRLYGDAGNDKVQGANGSDIVDGGPGQDQLSGDIASCSFSCTFDPDQLFARDGEQDTVDCGGGADRAQVDTLDIVAFCSLVDRQAVPGASGGGGPGGGGGAGGAASALALQVGKSVKLRALLKKGLLVRLKCAAACKVVATLSYKGKKLGVGRKTLRRAGKVRLSVKIGKKARAKVRRLKGKKLTLRIKVTSRGKTTTLTRKVTLKR